VKAAAQVPKLRFPGFEGEWLRQQLDAITSKKISYGIVQAGEHVPDGMPYIKSQDLNQPLALDSLQRTSEEIARKYRRSEVEPGDIVFSLRGNIGVCQIVPASIPEANLTQGTARIAVADYDNRLVAQTLQTLDVVRQIEACAKGSTFREISLEALRKITVALAPTFPEQQKIAAFLTAVDGRIEQLSRKKALLEATKKGVMQQLFTQTLRFQDDHGHDFPDWEEKTVNDVAECLDNLRRPVNGADREKMKGDIPYYGANGIQGYVNDFLFDEELTLLAEDGGNFDEFATRPIAQQISGKAWVNNHAHILRAKRKVMTPDFLFYSLVHKDVRQYINGSSRAKLNKGDMLTIEVVVPSLPEQTKIAGFLSALDGKIGAVGEQMRQTQAWKKGLLQQMFV